MAGGGGRRAKGSPRRSFARAAEAFAPPEKVGCGIRHKPRDPTHQGVNKHNKVYHFGFGGGGQRRVTRGHAPASQPAIPPSRSPARPPPLPPPQGTRGKREATPLNEIRATSLSKKANSRFFSYLILGIISSVVIYPCETSCPSLLINAPARLMGTRRSGQSLTLCSAAARSRVLYHPSLSSLLQS